MGVWAHVSCRLQDSTLHARFSKPAEMRTGGARDREDDRPGLTVAAELAWTLGRGATSEAQILQVEPRI